MIRIFIFLFSSIFFITSCSQDSGKNILESDIPLEENPEFPKFNNQAVFIKAKGIGTVNFDHTNKNMGMKSKEMFICVGDQYFIKEQKYCVYFDTLWIQNPIESDGGKKLLGLTAKQAYADKIFTDFLFNQAVFTIQNLDFILFSSVLHWLSKENRLESPSNSVHSMKNKNGDILTGHELMLDYKSQYFTMQKVTLTLQDNI